MGMWFFKWDTTKRNRNLALHQPKWRKLNSHLMGIFSVGSGRDMITLTNNISGKIIKTSLSSLTGNHG